MSFLYGVAGTSCFVDTHLSTVSVERTVAGRRESHARTVRTASSPESKRASLTFLITSGATSHQTPRIWSTNSWWGTQERGSLLWRFFTTPGCRHLQLPLLWQHPEYSPGWYYCFVRNLVVCLSFGITFTGDKLLDKVWLMTVLCHVYRNNSTKDLECYASEVISMNRMMQQHLLISEPTSFFIGNRDGDLLEELEETDSGDDLFMPSIKLSPPCSGLAKRRTFATLRNMNTSGEQSDSVDSLPSSHSSTYGVSV